MPELSHALHSARAAIEHPQCGRAFQAVVANAARPFGDRQALAIVLAVRRHPQADPAQKTEAAGLLAIWETKCGHWRDDRQNAHNAIPELPAHYRDWQPYLAVALNTGGSHEEK